MDKSHQVRAPHELTGEVWNMAFLSVCVNQPTTETCLKKEHEKNWPPFLGSRLCCKSKRCRGFKITSTLRDLFGAALRCWDVPYILILLDRERSGFIGQENDAPQRKETICDNSVFVTFCLGWSKVVGDPVTPLKGCQGDPPKKAP